MLYIHIFLGKDIGKVMPLNMFFCSKHIFQKGDVQNFLYSSSVKQFHKILSAIRINYVFYSGCFTAIVLQYFFPIKYINLIRKLFKDNIICHSAQSIQRTLVALFHLSAHVLLLQHHLKMKRSNVQKCLKGLTVFFKTKRQSQQRTTRKCCSPESIFAAKSNHFYKLS